MEGLDPPPFSFDLISLGGKESEGVCVWGVRGGIIILRATPSAAGPLAADDQLTGGRLLSGFRSQITICDTCAPDVAVFSAKNTKKETFAMPVEPIFIQNHNLLHLSS